MKNIYRKKLEKAALMIREVFDDLETEESDDFDEYGTRLADLAGELEDILTEDENSKNDEEEDEESGYEEE